MPSCNGGQGQYVPGRLAQVFGSTLYGIMNAAWNTRFTQRLAIPVPLGVENVAPGHERPERFFNKKGITLSQGVERIQQFAVEKAAHIKRGLLLLEDR